jgi:hypothetical protein
VRAENSVIYFQRQRDVCDLLCIDAVRYSRSLRPDEKMRKLGGTAE